MGAWLKQKQWIFSIVTIPPEQLQRGSPHSCLIVLLRRFFYMCVCLFFCSIATPLLATFSVSVVVVLHLYSNLNHIFFIKLWQMDKKWKTRGKKKPAHTHTQSAKQTQDEQRPSAGHYKVESTYAILNAVHICRCMYVVCVCSNYRCWFFKHFTLVT